MRSEQREEFEFLGGQIDAASIAENFSVFEVDRKMSISELQGYFRFGFRRRTGSSLASGG